jgi:hypothetical protein
MSAPDRAVLRVLVLQELMRAKSRVRWRPHDEEVAEDLAINNIVLLMLAGPSADLAPAAEVLERVLRSQISNSRPRG